VKDLAAWVNSKEFKRAAEAAGVPGIASTMYFLLDASSAGHRASPQHIHLFWDRLQYALEHLIYR
jgi:hypothetical protein